MTFNCDAITKKPPSASKFNTKADEVSYSVLKRSDADSELFPYICCSGSRPHRLQMAQHIIIAALFLAALAYLGYMVYKNFQSRSGCSSGCGSCGIDFTKLQKDLKKKGL